MSETEPADEMSTYREADSPVAHWLAVRTAAADWDFFTCGSRRC